MYQNSKSGVLDCRLGSPRWTEKGTIEFPLSGFLSVFSSICSPPTHHLATVHERDQPMTNQPATSRHALLEYSPLTIVSRHMKIVRSEVFIFIFTFVIPCLHCCLCRPVASVLITRGCFPQILDLFHDLSL